MATLSIKLEGLPELVRALRAMPAAVRGRVLESSVRAGAEIVARAAGQQASTAFISRTGRLLRTAQRLDRRMVRTVIRSPEYVQIDVWPRVPYAHLVEGGHRLVTRGPRRRVLGAVAPRPFIGPAFERTREQAAKVIIDTLWQRLATTWEAK